MSSSSSMHRCSPGPRTPTRRCSSPRRPSVCARNPMPGPSLKLGIVDLFGPAADLSGIAPGLVADAFVHQAVVKVDENGTEAAAASGIAIAESAPMIDLDVVVDRP